MSVRKAGFSSSQIIILGFAGMIIFGAILLMLPISTNDGKGAGLVEALFTATSASCVTGLVVRDTFTYWSVFGRCVILALIQIGGMGVVTMAIATFLISGRKISLKQRSTMQESISAHNLGGIVKLTGFIIKMTLIFEAAGAAALSVVFCREMGLLKGIAFGVFHSVSAFCNAGFDLMGEKGEFSSLTHYSAEPVVNITVMALIIIGGIGFMTWEDIRNRKTDFKRYRMQSKVIIFTTAILIFLPALYFFFFEFSSLPYGERLASSFFQSVTLRTAGFNTADLTRISETGRGIMIIMMIIGGSPGSTAGGIKTTTFAVLVSTAVSVFGKREHTHFFGRRINDSVVRNAATILTLYLAMFLAGGFIMSRTEGLPLLDCMFEAASAAGTVGLSMGITPGLGTSSRLILTALMYLGRVGGLTLIFAAFSGKKGNTARFPEEKMTVG